MTEIFLVKRDGHVYAVCSTHEKARELSRDIAEQSPRTPTYIHKARIDTFPMVLETVECFYNKR